MATRCAFVLKNGETVALYKHWDGYPAGAMWVVIRTIQYLQKYAWSQTHWWHDPETVASFMIAQDWDYTKEDPILKTKENNGWMKPDIRPILREMDLKDVDAKWVYYIDISEKRDQGCKWTYWTIEIRTIHGVLVAIVKVKFHYGRLSEDTKYEFDVEIVNDPCIMYKYKEDIDDMIKLLKQYGNVTVKEIVPNPTL